MTDISAHNPIIVAIDTTDVAQARHLAAAVASEVGGIKLGLEFFCAHGAEGVRSVLAGAPLPLFLDLKFHDIPNTVAGAIRAVAPLRPRLLTVHAGGGVPMLRAAATAAAEAGEATGNRPLVLGVTVLTSMDASDLAATGVAGDVPDQVRRLADLAIASGLDGIVCSAHEVAVLRALLGPGALLVVPGIRPGGIASGDQKRVMGPSQALAAGASHLVVGRPITEATDPVAAARALLNEAAGKRPVNLSA